MIQQRKCWEIGKEKLCEKLQMRNEFSFLFCFLVVFPIRLCCKDKHWHTIDYHNITENGIPYHIAHIKMIFLFTLLSWVTIEYLIKCFRCIERYIRSWKNIWFNGKSFSFFLFLYISFFEFLTSYCVLLCFKLYGCVCLSIEWENIFPAVI